MINGTDFDVERPLVRVHIPAALRRMIQGESSVCIGATDVRGLLANLCTRYPGLTEALLEPDGYPRRFVKIYVNEEDAQLARGVDTPLVNGDHVYILPAAFGD